MNNAMFNLILCYEESCIYYKCNCLYSMPCTILVAQLVSNGELSISVDTVDPTGITNFRLSYLSRTIPYVSKCNMTVFNWKLLLYNHIDMPITEQLRNAITP